jgi:hypothetical protein
MNLRFSFLSLAIASWAALVGCSSGPDNADLTEDMIESRTAELSLCKKKYCGPTLGAPSVVCADGSVGGPTGRCIHHADANRCSWEQRECPKDPAPTPSPVPPPVKDCGASGACPGPAPGAPNYTCDDGSTAGPVCSTTADGSCGWVIKTCPEPTPATCGKKLCGKTQTCCEGIPFNEPTCVEGTMCPISQRKHKKDIAYLSQEERERLRDELMSFRLATYRYKTEASTEREHLGFIIDDIAPSAAVTASGERVDMYGYQTMAVAAIQMQAREINALRSELEEMKRILANPSNGRAKR